MSSSSYVPYESHQYSQGAASHYISPYGTVAAPTPEQQESGGHSKIHFEGPFLLEKKAKGDEERFRIARPTYAHCIYFALKSVPGNAMYIRDIWEWIETNTDKVKSRQVHRCRNRVQSNLIMNDVC